MSDLLKRLAQDKGALLVLLIAPLLYSFYYPLAYKNEQLYGLPILVVDQDRSPDSRQLIRLLQASPYLTVVEQPASTQEAMHALATNQALGWVLIPEGYQQQLTQQGQSTLIVEGHGGFLMAGSDIMSRVGQVAATAGHQAKVLARASSGQAPTELQLNSLPLYNPLQGYGSYVVPAVFVMVLQQSLWIGMLLFVGWQQEQEPRQRLWQPGRLNLSRYGQCLLVFAVITFLQSMYSFGFALRWHQYPWQSNGRVLMLFSALFALAVASAGLCLSALLRQRETGMLLLLGVGIPIFFISGYPLPFEALPPALARLSWLLPSTAGIQGFMVINQMGLGWEYLGLPVQALLVQILFFNLLSLAVRIQLKRNTKGQVKRLSAP